MKEKAAEIAADFMTSFYGIKIGALQTQEFWISPVPFWLICFSDTVKGPIKNILFVVLLPDGTVVVPKSGEKPLIGGRWRGEAGCWRAAAAKF